MLVTRLKVFDVYPYSICYTRFPGTVLRDTPTCTENTHMSKAHDSNEAPNDGMANGN